MSRLAVFGTGYVGCVTAACLSRAGHWVIGVDVDRNKVAEINAGRSPVAEPGLARLIQEQVAAGRFRATTDLAEAVPESEIALISVGTPSTDDGGVCSRGVERVIADIGATLRQTRQPYIIVVRSTVPPGLLEERLVPRLEARAGRELDDELALCNNPEFLREGSAVWDFDHPPLVLVGSADDRAAQTVLDLYQEVHAEKIHTDTRTAALVKYACNAFHALKIAFANEIGTLARSCGADGRQVMELLCKDRKLNIASTYLRPGFAFGGSCLPKDLRALNRYMEQHALRLELLRSILPSNEAHLRRALTWIEKAGHRKLGIVGLSFKAGTDDLRESPLVILAEALLGRGFDLKVYDPHVQTSRLCGRNLAFVDRHLPHLAALLVESPEELYEHTALLVLGTDVADELDWQAHFHGEVFDLRADLTRPRSQHAALTQDHVCEV